MFENYFIFAVALLAVAVVLRGDFVLTLLYLFAGALFIGQWWSRRALKSVTIQRIFSGRAFLEEWIPVRLEVRNRSWLPLVWLRVHDGLPVELAPPNTANHILSLGPLGQVELTYQLHATKRGYYCIGPLLASTGDLLGLTRPPRGEYPAEYLTVYPRIVPFTSLQLPSRSPLGSLRYHQPIYEDPTRVLSKRDYVAGDSLRRIDWKATAASGRLQVKQFEPSIALETAIFLNLNADEYDLHIRLDASEFAIVLAASIASWVVGKKQTAGLVTNGLDPLSPESGFTAVPPRRGRGHLMRILDILARIQLAQKVSTIDLLRQQTVHLPWGTTVIMITPHVTESLFDELFQVRRAGMSVVIVVPGRAAHTQETRARAEHFGFPIYFFGSEIDLDTWRQ
jgi:uncharacterized protein (DUF58 family)